MTIEVEVRRSAKGESTNALIVQRAAELFAIHGFGAVSLRDVAAAAGLSHAALRRYFRSTNELLDAVVERMESDNHEWSTAMALDFASLDSVVELARHNAAVPGYVELFTALAGGGVSEEHPAHERISARYRGLRDAHRNVGADELEATLIAAMSDGLQLASLYDERIDVATELAAYLAWIRSGPLIGSPQLDAATRASLQAMRPGREAGTRGDLLAAGTAEFARRGFHGARLAEIAQAVGVSKSSLLHHFATKQDLLEAVLGQLDLELDGDPGEPSLTPPVRLQRIIGATIGTDIEATAAAQQIEALIVLTSEASARRNPMHAWWADKLRGRRQHLAADIHELRRAKQESDTNSLWPAPERAALWIYAARHGLRIQWLYDDSVDARNVLRTLASALIATAAG